jgi:hypothetical protein
MAKTRMPRDDNSQSIPVLRFRTGGAHHFNIDSSSANFLEVPLGTRVITLCCSVDAYFETGLSGVVASSGSHFIPAGVPFDMSLGTDMSNTGDYHTFVSVIAVSTSGVAHVSERE